MQILLIEDDASIAQTIVTQLKQAGHLVDHVASGGDGYVMAGNTDYDLLIVDRMLPVMDGLSLVEKLRAEQVQTPVLFLSALGEVEDRVDGLKAGGDDYLAKPFAISELLARVEALGRRQSNDATETELVVGDLTLDLLRHEATRDGQKIDLQPREYKLLEVLMLHHGQVVTRDMLLQKVWEYHFDPQTNVIDVHISRLRTKLDKPFERAMLKTVRGTGYMLSA